MPAVYATYLRPDRIHTSYVSAHRVDEPAPAPVRAAAGGGGPGTGQLRRRPGGHRARSPSRPGGHVQRRVQDRLGGRRLLAQRHPARAAGQGRRVDGLLPRRRPAHRRLGPGRAAPGPRRGGRPAEPEADHRERPDPGRRSTRTPRATGAPPSAGPTTSGGRASGSPATGGSSSPTARPWTPRPWPGCSGGPAASWPWSWTSTRTGPTSCTTSPVTTRIDPTPVALLPDEVQPPSRYYYLTNRDFTAVFAR